MKVISIGMGQNMFNKDSAARQRQVEYGKIFEELHIIVFSPAVKGFKSEKLSQNVSLYPTNSQKRIFYIFDFLKVIKSIVGNRAKGDFVLTVQDPFELGMVGLLAKILYSLPLQVQIHTDFVNRYFILHSPLNFIRFPLGLFILSFADSVRTVSKKVADSVKSLTHNVSVLPVYVESKITNSENKRGDKDEVVFLTVTRLEREKDLETAIKAFKKVLETGIRAIFKIVGDGSQRKNLEDLVKSLGIGDKVQFVGWQNDLVKYYQEADVYISTSLYEGYGMSVVEAAIQGLPLVLSKTGVAESVFKNRESAFVCNQKSESDFASAMGELANNISLRLKMAEMAQRSASSELLSMPEYLKRYDRSMNEALEFAKQNYGIFKKNILLRYLVAGFTSAGTQIILLYVFTDILRIWYLLSSVFSFGIALVLSFILQKFWTFDDTKTDNVHHQFVKYFGVAILGLVLNTGLMFVLVDILRLWYIWAQILTGAIIAIMNFLMYKFFIFNK